MTAAKADEGVLASVPGAAQGEASNATEVEEETLAAGPETGLNPPFPEHQQPPPVSPRAEIVRQKGAPFPPPTRHCPRGPRS